MTPAVARPTRRTALVLSVLIEPLTSVVALVSPACCERVAAPARSSRPSLPVVARPLRGRQCLARAVWRVMSPNVSPPRGRPPPPRPHQDSG
jgi:hypothetical protein